MIRNKVILALLLLAAKASIPAAQADVLVVSISPTTCWMANNGPLRPNRERFEIDEGETELGEEGGSGHNAG